MLLNMHIKNIALINEIDINFDKGLNILTGETGAGKSIIIGSLGICLGGKFSKELLRDETKDGLVELMFSVDNEDIRTELEAMEIYPDEDDIILISRRINGIGKTINRINDNTVTIGKLKEVAGLLIDLHAQHEQQTLLKVSKHMEILDRFGGDNISVLKLEVADLYNQYTKIKQELENESIDQAEKNRQMDFLTFQINEIEKANLKLGEDEELESLYKKVINSKEILTSASDVYSLTGYGSNSTASEQIGRALMQMKRMSELDEDLKSTYDTLVDIDSMLNDFNRELSQYMDSMEFDDDEFRSIETRLDTINTLKSKYGRTIEDINCSLDSYKAELERLVSFDEYMGKLKEKLNHIEAKLGNKCKELSAKRKEIAVEMCKLIKDALFELNFMSVEFEMKFQELEKYTVSGKDYAEFYISTNVGETIKPLSHVASGGELSRVMLALKSCIANLDATPSLVFDEIDVGISGRTAQAVAEKMSVIGRHHQVICITHLPQIAAMADTHYLIEKNVENNKTITNIMRLNKDDEINEIARLIGGAEITEATIASAKEMKGLADRTKIY